MLDSAQAELVADLAREQVAQLAPQEMPLFRAQSAAYFRDPASVFKPQQGKDEPLGFGAEEAITLLTPVALAVSTDVVQYLISQVQSALKAESADFIRATVRQMFARLRPGTSPGPAAPPPLTQAQLNELHRLALAKALQLHLPEDQAALLADSLIGSLVTTT